MSWAIIFLIARIIFCIVFPFAEGTKDGNSLSKNSFWYHGPGWFNRAFASFVALPYPEFAGLYVAYFWFTFEWMRNKAAGDDPFYVGNTAWSDKHFGKKVFIFKIIFLIAGITISILNLTKL